MRTAAILPVKNLDQTKSRLSPCLSLKGRRQLTCSLLRRTINIIQLSGKVETVVVVTPDQESFSFAKIRGVIIMIEKEAGLNSSLEQATEWCRRNGFEALLILPSDIPFLRIQDVHRIIAMGRGQTDVVVIAPDAKREGTNALFVKPPGILNYCFGCGSYNLHRKQALLAGSKLKIYFSESVAFDIDYPEQYDILYEAQKENEYKRRQPYTRYRNPAC